MKNTINVISTGSHGNAVLYHNSILIDAGVPYKQLEPYKNQIQLLLLTHKHCDHINESTIKQLVFERPSLRIGCGEHMKEYVKNYRNVDILEIGKVYDYGTVHISPIKLYHDVPNYGYRILKPDYKIIHATDTAHLEGITAVDYDLFAIEHNYNEERLLQNIIDKKNRGEYAYGLGSSNSHLSDQQANEFIRKNRKSTSLTKRLHESRHNS